MNILEFREKLYHIGVLLNELHYGNFIDTLPKEIKCNVDSAAACINDAYNCMDRVIGSKVDKNGVYSDE